MKSISVHFKGGQQLSFENCGVPNTWSRFDDEVVLVKNSKGEVVGQLVASEIIGIREHN